MNVLITSAGRRTSLLRAFKCAVGEAGAVFAGDLDPLAPALYLADRAFALPPVTRADYIPHVLDLVTRHQIGLVVPTIDTELPSLAAHAARFAEVGGVALVSSPAFVTLTRDKWLTGQHFAAAGVATPRAWLPEALDDTLPERLFVKPRDGSASRDTHRTPRARLAEVLPRVANAVVQEELRGPEITVDALLDFAGTPLHYVPRLRLRTLAGESIQGVTLPDTELRPWLVKTLGVAGRLGARGPITLQAFLTPTGPVLSEINARFGGGFPLCYAAGGRYPEWLLELLAGAPPVSRLGAYRAGLHMTRYYCEHFTTEPLWSPASASSST